MPYPEEFFQEVGNAGTFVVVGDIHADVSCNCIFPDGPYAPTYNNYGDVDIDITGATNNWPAQIINIDSHDIVVNEDGTIDGGDDFPDGTPRIVSIKSKHLYSSLRTDFAILAELWKEIQGFLVDVPNSANYFLFNQAMYLNQFRNAYLTLFDYGQLEKFSTIGFSGSFNQIWALSVNPFIKTPGTFNNLLGKWYEFKLADDANVFSNIIDTNILKQRIWRGNVDICPGVDCPGATPHPVLPIHGAGISNSVDCGFSIKRLSLQIEPEDPQVQVYQQLIVKLLASGILQIEKLRTNYEGIDPKTLGECCLGNDPAYEHLIQMYMWEPVFQIPINRIFVDHNPLLYMPERGKNVDIPQMTFDEEQKKWVPSTNPKSMYYSSSLYSGMPNIGYWLDVPLFLAPGSVWRAKIILDPRKIVWTLAKFVDVLPPAGTFSLPMPVDDLRFILSFEGLEFVYEWPEPVPTP